MRARTNPFNSQFKLRYIDNASVIRPGGSRDFHQTTKSQEEDDDDDEDGARIERAVNAQFEPFTDDEILLIVKCDSKESERVKIRVGKNAKKGTFYEIFH